MQGHISTVIRRLKTHESRPDQEVRYVLEGDLGVLPSDDDDEGGEGGEGNLLHTQKISKCFERNNDTYSVERFVPKVADWSQVCSENTIRLLFRGKGN